MMWAATVRRCPTGHSRHPSQFGARLQLARALTHAPYLICDGVYSCSPSVHTHYNSELNVPYHIPFGESNTLDESNNLCDHIVDCDNQSLGQSVPFANRSVCTQGVYASSRLYCTDNLSNPGTPRSSCMPRGRLLQDVDEVRVELPYSRRELEIDDDYPLSERIIRRYDEIQGRDDAEEEGIVGLSYQQQSMGDNGPYNGEVWGSQSSIDCWGDRPLLLKRGKTRELVRTMFVVSLSFLLVTFVVMGFEMYNMVITSIFILFFLSTLCLLLFLLMRKPTCFSCCRDSLEDSNSINESSNTQQQGLNVYLRESQGAILKKRLSDSPPPYESPPDYNSLPPEILVNARDLSGLDAPSENILTRVHGEEQPPYCSSQKDISRTNVKHGRLRNMASSSSSSLLETAPILASSKSSPSRSSLPTSPNLYKSSEVFGSSCKSQCVIVPSLSSKKSSSPPPYECVVLRTELTKDELKPC